MTVEGRAPHPQVCHGRRELENAVQVWAEQVDLYASRALCNGRVPRGIQGETSRAQGSARLAVDPMMLVRGDEPIDAAQGDQAGEGSIRHRS